MRYVTISELVYINGTVLDNPKILSGTLEIRAMDLLEAAAARPAASAFGEDAYPTLNEKVAALLHSLARNHAFTDGNKRTAAIAAIFMFQINGQRLIWQPAAALTMILEVAEGRCDLARLAAWFPLVPTDPHPEAQADRDMQIIAQLIDEHRELLDELARR